LLLASAHQVSVQFGQKVVLSEVDLSVKSGEIVSLIGPNGAGKSTLIRAILGLTPLQHGNIQLNPGIRVGYMPQKIHLESFMPLSVKRFLQLVPDVKSADIMKILQDFNLEHLQSIPIPEISGGELQRVLLARALLRTPSLLVLDEPAQGVDVTGQEALYQLITHIRDSRGCGILMVSHDLHLVMAGTDSVVCLNKHVCCSGHPSVVSQHPAYLNLFGQKEPARLWMYAHQHNHQHDLDGNLCN
jgi:zinc transport system ATP-binding protein